MKFLPASCVFNLAKTLPAFLATIVATTILAITALTTPALADYSLTILHTNDFHSRFLPISKFDSMCSDESNAEGKCFGGTARLVTAVSDARTRAKNSLLVDGGDQFQGTLYYTYYKGKVAAEMMNKLGYDAMTVGNHEFDDGPEVLRGFIDSVGFPVLMSNADISREPTLRDVLKKSTILTVGGEQIGLIGLTPQDTDELASPGKNITFFEPVKAVQTEVDKFAKQGINKIIVLSHSGYNVDKLVAEQTTGVDVIVGGHSNTYLSNVSDRAVGPYPTVIGDTAIIQAYAYGKFLGELNVVFDDAGKIKSAIGEPLIMDQNVDEDSGTIERLVTLGAPLDEIRNKVVANANAPIDGDRMACRIKECEMGNLIAEAMLDAVASKGVQVAIMNSGGIRASIDAGEVTMGEVLGVLPFQNTLSTFKVSGHTLIDALENGVSQIEDVKGRFPQVAGLKYSFDISVAPNEGRIQSVMAKINGRWAMIDKSASYYVVSNNYVRGGGDGYKMFITASDVYDYGPDLADVVADYLDNKTDFKPFLDGRISQK